MNAKWLLVAAMLASTSAQAQAHRVSAFATQLSAVVGDLAVAPDENEITAALALLKELPLEGAIVTGDAIFAPATFPTPDLSTFQ